MSWSQFQTILKYKVKWCSEQLVVISKTFTSSQLCSNCNYKNIDAKNLIIREQDCPYCGTQHDGDRNTALNLRNEANRRNYRDSLLNQKPLGFCTQVSITSRILGTQLSNIFFLTYLIGPFLWIQKTLYIANKNMLILFPKIS